MSLQDFKDKMAGNIFGMTLTEAWEKGVCIDCKTKMVDLEPLADIDIREWKISAICPICWDKIAKEE